MIEALLTVQLSFYHVTVRNVYNHLLHMISAGGYGDLGTSAPYIVKRRGPNAGFRWGQRI